MNKIKENLIKPKLFLFFKTMVILFSNSILVLILFFILIFILTCCWLVLEIKLLAYQKSEL